MFDSSTRVGISHSVGGLLDLGTLGLILADQIAHDIEGEPWVRVPRALLHRLARYLEAAAALVEDGLVGYDADPDQTRGLPAAFRSDGELLRTLADAAH